MKQLFGKTPVRNAVNERSIRLYLALKEIVERENFDSYSINRIPDSATITRPHALRRA